MNRRFRLTRSTDFKRVRRMGRSFAHPLVVLIALPNEDSNVHVGIAAGRSVGGAVVRNKVKRRLRAILRPMLPSIKPGWDLVLVARKMSGVAEFSELQQAVTGLLNRAGLIRDEMA